MFASLIMCAALIAQAPPARPIPDRPILTEADKRKAKRAAQNARYFALRRAEAIAAREMAEEQRRQFDKYLPAMLELNRQALARQSAIERNMAENAKASAMEHMAQAIDRPVYQYPLPIPR